MLIRSFQILFFSIVVFPSMALWASEPLHPSDDYGRSKFQYDSYERKSIYIRVSDGTRLAADVYFPTGYKGGGNSLKQFPTILIHTPYRRSQIHRETGEEAATITENTANAMPLINYGYAMVISETRGTGASSGTAFIFGDRYQKDASDVVDWIADQPWSNGLVGMVGSSHFGWTQLAAAAHKPKALKAIMPAVVPMEAFTGQMFPGGISMQGFLRRIGLSEYNQAILAKSENFVVTPVLDEDGDGELLDEIPLDLNGNDSFLDDYDPNGDNWPPQYSDGNTRQHSHFYAFYNRREPRYFFDYKKAPFIDAKSPETGENSRDIAANLVKPISETGVAIYNIGGWYDAFPRGTIEYFSTLSSTNPSRLMMFPGFHAVLNGFMYDEYGAEGADLRFSERLRFFDHYLKGIENGIDQEPPVLIYNMMGDGWRQENEWPLARQQVRTLYFDEGGVLTKKAANRGADDYQVIFDHDRRYGRNLSSRWTAITGRFYPRGKPDMTEQDKESLVYNTEPLSQDMEVTGHPIVKLWVSSTASDGDFYVFMEDVDENGRSLMVTQGQLRASWADLHDNDEMTDTGIKVLPELPWHGYERGQQRQKILADGRIIELVIDLLPTSWTFKKGHKLRIAITGANYPDFELNPVLSPSNNPCAKDNVEPTISIHRGPKYSSVIELPVIP